MQHPLVVCVWCPPWCEFILVLVTFLVSVVVFDTGETMLIQVIEDLMKDWMYLRRGEEKMNIAGL